MAEIKWPLMACWVIPGRSTRGFQVEQPPSTALAAAGVYLLSSLTAADGIQDFGGSSKPFSTASEAFPKLSPCPPTIQREIQTHSRPWAPGWDCDVHGYLNLPIQNQLLHSMNVCGLSSSFAKKDLLRAKLPKQGGCVTSSFPLHIICSCLRVILIK